MLLLHLKWDHIDPTGIPRPRIEHKLDEFTGGDLQALRAMHDRIFDAVGVSFRKHSAEFFGAGHRHLPDGHEPYGLGGKCPATLL